MNPALVRRAAAELFNEGFMHAEVQRKVRSTPEHLRMDAYESLQPKRTVPDGCFDWIDHLVWLEKMLELVDLQLTASEATGIVELRRERARFQREHPACPQCGMPNEPHAFTCRECLAEIGNK